MFLKKAMVVARQKRYAIYTVIILIIAIILWELIVDIFNIPTYTIPSPSAIYSAFVVKGASVWLEHTWVTTLESVSGFVLGTAIGVGLAIILTLSDLIRSVFTPILVFIQTLPKVAVAPIFVVWLGLGFVSKITIAFLIVFFTVMISTMVGLLIDPEMEYLARSFKASKWKIMWGIRIPHSLPSMFAGMKIGATQGVIGAVVAEFVGSEAGLGWLILTFQAYLDMPAMFVTILLLGVVGYLFYQVVCQAEKIAIPWYTHK